MAGFTTINNDLLDNNEISLQEQSLIIAIISYLGKGIANPSYKGLKQRSKIKKDITLIKTLNLLKDKGYIEIIYSKGRRNTYKLTPKVEYLRKWSTSENGRTPTPKVEEQPTPKMEYKKESKNKIEKINKQQQGYDSIITSFTENQELKTSILDFIKMRKTIKKPLTDKGLNLILKKLDKVASSEKDKIEVLNQSIMNCWQGVFEVKKDNSRERCESGEHREHNGKAEDTLYTREKF